MAAGGVAEWTIAAVLKTAEVQASGGSNPSPSANTEHESGPRRSHADRLATADLITALRDTRKRRGTTGSMAAGTCCARTASAPGKVGGVNVRGLERGALADAFSRYLPPPR
jgi:hypothetical protein